MHGVAGLHLLHRNVDQLPVRARIDFGIAQIDGHAGCAAVLVDLACLQAAGTDRAGGNHNLVARPHGGQALVAAVVPDLTLSTDAAGFAAGIGGGIHGSSVKAQVLPVHREQILCRRGGRHHGVAERGAQVDTPRRRQHIGVDAVEGNRQANRHRDTVTGTGQRR